MVDTLILDIKQAMSSTLTNGQMEKLHKVLAHYFYDLEIIKKEGAETEEKQNIEYLEAFLSAKHVEGCSRKSLKYYKATIENLFKKIEKSIKHITTNDLREYLDNYQKEGNASKITIDNIRRIFSSRRRHTRLSGDWSSDVCSSDLLKSFVVICLIDFSIFLNKFSIVAL